MTLREFNALSLVTLSVQKCSILVILTGPLQVSYLVVFSSLHISKLNIHEVIFYTVCCLMILS